MNIRRCLLALLLLPLALFADVEYVVRWSGVENPTLLERLTNASSLVTLQERPPATLSALKHRAKADQANLIEALHSLARYNGAIHIDYNTKVDPVIVTIHVEAGPAYPLMSFHVLDAANYFPNLVEEDPYTSSFDIEGFLQKDYLDEEESGLKQEVEPGEEKEENSESVSQGLLASFTPSLLGLHLGDPAYPKSIQQAEELLLRLLRMRGYPFAKVVERDVVADQAAKELRVSLYVDPGPYCVIGPIRIIGCKRTKTSYVLKKLRITSGQLYHPQLFRCAEERLEDTGLFRYVDLELEPPKDTECGENPCPLHVTVHEGLHRSIGIGGSITTQRGMGGLIEWEDRNITGIADRLTLQFEVLQKSDKESAHQPFFASCQYIRPDFWQEKQELITNLWGLRDVTRAYDETVYGTSCRIRRPIAPRMLAALGCALEYHEPKRPGNISPALLAKLIGQYHWHYYAQPLDPQNGFGANLYLAPTVQLNGENHTYCRALGDVAFYWTPREGYTLALNLTLGSVMGTSRVDLVPGERFYAGGPDLLRGYRYRTVSPIGPNNQILGGKSLVIYSAELRARIYGDWGGVLFYDMGNVFAPSSPCFTCNLLRAVGVGIRYYTAVGPLRVDVALPLDRRAGIDGPYQIYFSIGQAF